MNLYQKMADGEEHLFGGVRFSLSKYRQINPDNAFCNLHMDSNYYIHPRSRIVIEERRYYVSTSLLRRNKWKYHVDLGRHKLGIEFMCRFGSHIIRGKSIHNVIKQAYQYSISSAKLEASFTKSGHFYFVSDTQTEMYKRHESVYNWFNKPWRDFDEQNTLDEPGRC